MLVICTVSTKEEDVKKILENMGYKILCPRKTKIERGKDVTRVIFTSYLFLDMNSITDKDYYKIKNTINVIGFLSNKYHLSNFEEEYIRILNNNDNPITRIEIYFARNGKAIVVNGNSVFKSSNIIRINKRSKTVTFRINILDKENDITFNYDDIA